MYITRYDYIGRISASLLDILIADTEADVIEQTSKEAEDTIASMAGVVYEILPELALEGAARNYYILSLAKSIGLYFLYQRADDQQIPEKVIKNYDDAMNDLEKISTGKKALNLPPKVDTTGATSAGEGGSDTEGAGLRRIGSQKKRSHIV